MSREKVKTTPGSLECLGATECRQKGGNTIELKPHEVISIWMGNGFFILTLNCDHCEQVADTDDMARPARGRGRRGGKNGPRPKDLGTSEQKKGRRPMDETVGEAAKAYMEGTDAGIQKIIEEMEDRILEEDSKDEMEEWKDLIPDPGNTKGRLSKFK